jgi:hypothetical protein
MPKKERMCVPIKYEPIRRKKEFTAIRQDSARRVLDEYSLVIARKMGLPPSGSTMGNSALRTRNKLFAASAMTFISAARARFNLGGIGHRSSGRNIPHFTFRVQDSTTSDGTAKTFRSNPHFRPQDAALEVPEEWFAGINCKY